MIHRILIWLILGIVLPYVYLYRRFWQHRDTGGRCGQWRWLWWLPPVGMLIFTFALSACRDFVPTNMMWIRLYLYLLGIFVLPQMLFTLCLALGQAGQRWCHCKKHLGYKIGFLLVLLFLPAYYYGLLWGWRGLEVRHVDICLKDLPKSFDGYRIVHFSDAHVGTFIGVGAKVLQRDIDSINAQKADLIVFTGDLQNVHPSELYPFKHLLGSLKAKDGVVSILGNHDYSAYTVAKPAVAKANERLLRSMEYQMGWRLLANTHWALGRGQDSIYLAGEENESTDSRFNHLDRAATYAGIPRGSFVIALQHNPERWPEALHPHGNRPLPRLTLSGHTHGGQISILGWRPTQWRYRYDYGLAELHGHYLYVSGGIGGLVPFRLGVTPEITVITLHHSDI